MKPFCFRLINIAFNLSSVDHGSTRASYGLCWIYFISRKLFQTFIGGVDIHVWVAMYNEERLFHQFNIQCQDKKKLNKQLLPENEMKTDQTICLSRHTALWLVWWCRKNQCKRHKWSPCVLIEAVYRYKPLSHCFLYVYEVHRSSTRYRNKSSNWNRHSVQPPVSVTPIWVKLVDCMH